jgi:hypothetical protein
MYLHECVAERREHTDQRWVKGVGAGGGKPGSNARVWRSLDVDHVVNAEPAERGYHNNSSEEDYRDGRSGEVSWRCVPEDQPLLENPVRRI